VLRAFDRATPELTAAEIVRRLNLPRTVITRLLATLEQAGFVERMPGTLKYRIGLATCEIGALHLIGNPLLKVADPFIDQLAENTGFTAYLGVIYGDEVVILALREGRMPVRFTWSAGERLPVATTALGKSMLMHMDPAEIDRILGTDELAGLTESSLRTRRALDEQLESHRSIGWIPAIEESFPGVCAVGAAILDPKGAPVAGISLSFLGNASAAEAIDEKGKAVVEAARAISHRLATFDLYRQTRVYQAAIPRNTLLKVGET